MPIFIISGLRNIELRDSELPNFELSGHQNADLRNFGNSEMRFPNNKILYHNYYIAIRAKKKIR